MTVQVHLLRYLLFTPHHVSDRLEGDLPPSGPARLDALFHPRAQTTSLCHPIAQSNYIGTGISTCCPSTTPFGLALGPDLPWADEPSPGNLSLSVDEILTHLALLTPAFSLLIAPLLLTV